MDTGELATGVAEWADSEPWRRDHVQVQQCWKLEDSMAEGLKLFSQMKSIIKMYGDANQELPEDFLGDCDGWRQVAVHHLPGIYALEGVGLTVSRAREFREALAWYDDNVHDLFLDIEDAREADRRLSTERASAVPFVTGM